MNIVTAMSLGLLGIASCSRTPVKPQVATSPESPSTGVAATPVAPLGRPINLLVPDAAASSPAQMAQPLTATGDNSDGRFSPDGTRIVFVSRFRPNHKQAQVYELHLGRMTEKRITFHDGDDAGPIYSPDGNLLIFASTTDEVKDESYAIGRLMKAYDPEAFQRRSKGAGLPDRTSDGFELYQQTLHGRSIERLSNSPGFDGDADIDSKGKRIMLSSARDADGTHLFMMHARSTARITEGRVVDRGARFSPDGLTLVWSRQDVGQSDAAKLMIANGGFRKAKVLLDAPGLSLQPTWNPTGTEVIFSSNMGGKFFNLFSIDSDGHCVRRLTAANVDQHQPALSPDGHRILFTASDGGHQQIYVMDYLKPKECWHSPGPAPGPSASPSPTPAPTGG